MILFTINAKAQYSSFVNAYFSSVSQTLQKEEEFRIEFQIFQAINQKRLQFGIKPVKWREETAQIARFHSDNLAKFDFLSHYGIDGKTVGGRADDFGLKKWKMIGENVACLRGYPDFVNQVVESWMASPSHRQNLLNPRWKESGIGVAHTNSGKIYFTQVFLLRK